MNLLFASMLIASVPVNPAHAGRMAAIEQCNKVELQYGKWAVDFRFALDRNSTDYGGDIDQSLILDINFALASAKEYVNNNIQFVQRAQFRGSEPSVQECRQVARSAQQQIESYVRILFNDIHPTDRGSRRAAIQEFRLGLQESTRQFQGR